jgi:putative oxidoreductase
MVNGMIPASYTGPLLSILRIMTGLLFFAHGSAKLLMFPATKNFSEGVSLFSFAGFTGALEFIGGALITLGLFTRITAFILSGMMAVAYFMAHAPRDFYPINNGGELAILFCFMPDVVVLRARLSNEHEFDRGCQLHALILRGCPYLAICDM